jgi:hypothetical protein
MDLIEMPPVNGFRYILRVVDHLSQYGSVAPLRERNSEEVGSALIEILCQAIVPEILQSDNGGEVSQQLMTYQCVFTLHKLLNNDLLCHQFLGDCITQVHANFPWVHIVCG